MKHVLNWVFAQCDGRQPCVRCQRASADCLYKKRQRELITDLLAEIERLKNENAEKDKLLETFAFSHDVETCKTVIQNLKDGNKSRQDVLVAMDSKTRSDNVPFSNQRERAVATGSVHLDTEPTVCSYCSCRLRPWQLSRSSRYFLRFAEATATLSSPGLPSPVSLPSFYVNRDAAQSQADSWTTFGLTGAYLGRLFSALATWDCLPFCIVCEVPFTKNFATGSRDFCSQALVNALLALAIRVVIETENETEPPPANCLGSKQVFDDADKILRKGEQPSHLPDIQALGILSIYEISCGRKAEAEKLAQLFYSSVIDLCDRESLEEKDEQYVLVRTTAYCGAVSLIRYEVLLSFASLVCQSTSTECFD